jgi:hypothetical protein
MTLEEINGEVKASSKVGALRSDNRVAFQPAMQLITTPSYPAKMQAKHSKANLQNFEAFRRTNRLCQSTATQRTSNRELKMKGRTIRENLLAMQ